MATQAQAQAMLGLIYSSRLAAVQAQAQAAQAGMQAAGGTNVFGTKLRDL